MFCLTPRLICGQIEASDRRNHPHQISMISPRTFVQRLFTPLTSTILLATIVCFPERPAGAIELISNGGFEAGNFSGWTIPSFPGGFTNSGSWFIDTPGTETPLSAYSTAGNAAGGSFYAVTDQTWFSTHALSQTFTVPGAASSVVLSFKMFVNDYHGSSIVDPIGLDHTGPANQHARVDILT